MGMRPTDAIARLDACRLANSHHLVLILAFELRSSMSGKARAGLRK